MTTELLVGLTSIIVLGIIAQWIAWRLIVPSILVLLLFGFLAGPVFGLLDPDAVLGPLLFPIVSMSVAVILFEGGLTLRFSELREIGMVVRNLVTLGALVTWVGCSLAAWIILGLAPGIAVLFGAILTVSGPTVIMPLLRHVNPNRRVGSILKWEGIVIDPIGAMLAVLVFEAILAGGIREATLGTLTGLITTVLIGSAIGAAAAVLLVIVLMRYWIPDALQNPVALMMVLGAFALSNYLQHESGLFAVTVMGIVLANQKRIETRHILEFKENLRPLLIAGIFIILSARLNFSEVIGYLNPNLLLFLIVALFVVRPAAVWLSSIGSSLSLRERAFLAWMAPRGIVAAAVSSVFALSLTEAGYADAAQLAPLTFLVIVGTVTIYGLTAAPIGRLLGVTLPSPHGVLIVGAHTWGRAIAHALQEAGFRVLLIDTNMANVTAAASEKLSAAHGSVLSEYVLDKVGLEGIGRMLALTSNDEINSLAALHFTERFGRSEVYQLSPSEGGGEFIKAVPKHLRGRQLFTRAATHEYFEEHFENGAEIATFAVTNTRRYPDLRTQMGERFVPLFVVGPGNDLQVFTESNSPEPIPGQKVIAMIAGDGEVLDAPDAASRFVDAPRG